jgi:hypothetical protein
VFWQQHGVLRGRSVPAPVHSFFIQRILGAYKPPDDCLDNGEHINTQEGTTFASKQLTNQGRSHDN